MRKRVVQGITLSQIWSKLATHNFPQHKFENLETNLKMLFSRVSSADSVSSTYICSFIGMLVTYQLNFVFISLPFNSTCLAVVSIHLPVFSRFITYVRSFYYLYLIPTYYLDADRHKIKIKIEISSFGRRALFDPTYPNLCRFLRGAHGLSAEFGGVKTF